MNSQLRQKGFFVADNATSNHGYTHYSLSATLDLMYLNEFNKKTSITLRDLLRGTYTIADNNTTRLFERSGYAIENFSIFNNKRHPAKGTRDFTDVPRNMIKEHHSAISNFITIKRSDFRSAKNFLLNRANL